MRKLQYLVAASLDGRICRLDGSFDDFPTEGDHVPDYFERLRGFDAVLMGRKTYEIGLREGETNPYPTMESFVFSRSMPESPDPGVKLVSENAAEFVRGLKTSAGGDIYLCGGASLAACLFEAGLIDEVVVKLNPLVLGDGLPLFQRVSAPTDLRLVDLKRYNSGVVLLTYRAG